MKDLSVYDFKSYKKYIKAWIHALPAHGHGERKRIGAKVGCNSAYVSHVLERDGHFSMEQAALLCQHMNLNELETRFLLLLVQYERAGHPLWRNQIKSQMDEILESRLTRQHQLEHREGLSIEDQATYYSTWHYSAVHVLLLLPDCRTRDAVSKRLRIPPRKAAEILEFLARSGLAQHENGEYRYGPVQVFVPETSPLSSKGHINWRLKAMASLDQILPEDLHLTTVATLNGKDVPAVREVLMKAAEEIHAIIRNSGNEDTLICLDLDLFRP